MPCLEYLGENWSKIPDATERIKFVLASYNAGPGAVRRWINKYSFTDPDEYVENIPYQETRDYVKHVLQNYWIYRELYS